MQPCTHSLAFLRPSRFTLYTQVSLTRLRPFGRRERNSYRQDSLFSWLSISAPSAPLGPQPSASRRIASSWPDGSSGPAFACEAAPRERVWMAPPPRWKCSWGSLARRCLPAGGEGGVAVGESGVSGCSGRSASGGGGGAVATASGGAARGGASGVALGRGGGGAVGVSSGGLVALVGASGTSVS